MAFKVVNHPSASPLPPNPSFNDHGHGPSDSRVRSERKASKVLLPAQNPAKIRQQADNSIERFRPQSRRQDGPSAARVDLESFEYPPGSGTFTSEQIAGTRSAPRCRREQPIRALKIMPSIEDQDVRHYSPSFGKQESDAEWTPRCAIKSPALSFGSSPITSPQGSPNQRRTGNSILDDAKSQSLSMRHALTTNLQAGGGCPSSIKYEVVKPEDTPRSNKHYIGPKTFSPTLDVESQEQRLEKHGFVEVHKSHVAYAQWQKAAKENEEQIASLKAAYVESIKQPAGQQSERYIDLEEWSPEGGERPESLKRWEINDGSCDSPRSSKEKMPNESRSSNMNYGDDSQASQSRDGATSVAKPASEKLDAPFALSGHTASMSKTSVPAYTTNSQNLRVGDLKTASRTLCNGLFKRGRGRWRLNQARRNKNSRLPLLERREIEFPPDQCKCDVLHWYFTQPGLKYPDIERFPGSKAEFLAHAEQVAGCNAHDPILINHCQRVIKRESRCHWVCSILNLIFCDRNRLTSLENPSERIPSLCCQG